MFKALLLTLNLFALIALKFIFGGDVSVSQNFPAEVKDGESFVMEINIEKGDREGFAKWQQKLPNGFIATPKETAGATFSFKNQEVKLIWMALPDTETVQITYEIEIEPSLMGEFELSGKFSFIEGNERKDISSASRKILVGVTREEVASKDDPIPEEAASEVETENAVVAALPVTTADIPVTDSKEEATSEESTAAVAEVKTENQAKVVLNTEEVKISRDLQHIADGVYSVQINIEKGATTSFGKIEEYLPEDFTAEIVSAEGGVVTFNNRVLKVMWMTLPAKNELNVAYTLTSNTDLFDSTEVHGVFSYLSNDRTSQLELEASHFRNYYVNPNAEELADVVEEPIVEEPTDKIESPVSVVPVVEVVSDVKTPPASPSKSNESIEAAISNVPAPETDIAFRVQIAAGKKEVAADYFLKKYALKEKVNIEYHETWYKYTLASLPSYKMARDQRNELWNREKGFKDAFVSAYNTGERISVQEALMISKQKWLK